VPVTPEQRDNHLLCGAKKKSGEVCRAYAGQGTDHFGIGRCKFHAGSTPTHRQSAAVAEAKQRMVRMGKPIPVEPHEALLAMLHLASGHVAWLQEEIAGFERLAGDEARLLTTLYGEERDRVARIAKAALEAGVAERQVRLAEGYGTALAELLRGLFDDPELALSRRQRDRLPDILRRHLRPAEPRPALAPAKASPAP
jgi:hypothetical protein